MKEILQKALSTRGAQARLSVALGLPSSTVNNWAKGKNTPEAYRWPEIEAALGMEPGVLARAAGVVRPPHPDSDRLDDPVTGSVPASTVMRQALPRRSIEPRMGAIVASPCAIPNDECSHLGRIYGVTGLRMWSPSAVRHTFAARPVAVSARKSGP